MAERNLKQVLNEANPNTIADAQRVLPLGNALANGVQSIRAAVVANVLVLPDGFKAALVIGGYAVAGGTTGALTPTALGGTVATTQVAIQSNGDLLFFAGDAVTEAEVFYVPAEGTLVEETVAVASDLASMGANRKARVLVSVTATTGGSDGSKTVVARGSTPAAGEAALNDDGVIEFAAADAITQATVAYIQYPVGTSVGDNLAADSTIL